MVGKGIGRSRALKAGALICLAVVPLWLHSTGPDLRAATARSWVDTPSEPLAVLTYNIHGLPWPVVDDRAADLRAIADRLSAMRRQGAQPSVVVLQEAFTDEAEEIGEEAGYRFVIEGPSRSLWNDARPDAADKAFAAGARWTKGEGVGRVYGSGLMLLSDLPVLDVKRVAFPSFACAGYDCLANKGALLVTVRDERTGQPVQILTTHLNSRRSSYVPDDRSFYAYGRQLDALTGFVRRNRDPSRPLIAAGDFNASSPERRAALLRAAADWRATATGGVADALDHCLSSALPCGDHLPADTSTVQRRGRDWQFYDGGSAARLNATAIAVPFGPARDGTMLSDHIGYTVGYSVSGRALAARS